MSLIIKHLDDLVFIFGQVVFRLIMFRPFVGEIIAAKVKESNATGLRCMSCASFTYLAIMQLVLWISFFFWLNCSFYLVQVLFYSSHMLHVNNVLFFCAFGGSGAKI